MVNLQDGKTRFTRHVNFWGIEAISDNSPSLKYLIHILCRMVWSHLGSHNKVKKQVNAYSRTG